MISASRAIGRACVVATLFSSCTGELTSATAKVESVNVTAPHSALVVGETLQLTATPVDASGAALTQRTITWTSSSESVAKVSAAGLVIAVAQGTATIVATVDGVSGKTDLSVGPARIATIVIESPSSTVPAGTGIQLNATAKDENGNAVSGAPLTWSSSDERIAKLSSSGAVLGISPGLVTITVSSGSTTGSIILSVVPGAPASGVVTPGSSLVYVGTTRQLVATFKDALGNLIPSPSVLWSSSDPLAVSVSSTGVAEGQLVSGTAEISATSGSAVARARVNVLSVKALDLGDSHGCYLSQDEKIFCWGANSNAELGLGVGSSPVLGPVAVSPNLTFTKLSAGASHSCAIASDSILYCWGANDSGEVGNGIGGDQLTPAAIGGSLRFNSVAAGRVHTCATTTSVELYCWGGSSQGPGTPTKVQTSIDFRSLVAGIGFTCGLDPNGNAYCWGLPSPNPIVVANGVPFRTLVAGDDFRCGLSADNITYCWGHLPWGTTNFLSSTFPVAAPGNLRFKSIATGSAHLCGVTLEGKAFCLGSGFAGQLGNGTNGSSSVFVPVTPGISNVTAFNSIFAGHFGTCAITAEGAPHCWGPGAALGIGTQSTVFSPVPMTAP